MRLKANNISFKRTSFILSHVDCRYSFLEIIILIREGFKKKKKKLEFSNRGGRGSENKKKIPTFPKTVPFYLECHDSARNVIKFFLPYVPPHHHHHHQHHNQFCCCPTSILMFMEACLYIAIVIYIMI